MNSNTLKGTGPRSLPALLLAGLCLCAHAAGDEPGCRHRRWPGGDFRHPCPACPDDYCPKKLPVTCPLRYCGPDDYCRKPCPPVPPTCWPPSWTCGPACAPPCSVGPVPGR